MDDSPDQPLRPIFIASVINERGKLGAAYFDPTERSLNVLHQDLDDPSDPKFSPDMEPDLPHAALRAFCTQIAPLLIITPSKLPSDSFLKVIHDCMPRGDPDTSEQIGDENTAIETRPCSEFTANWSRTQMIQWMIDKLTADASSNPSAGESLLLEDLHKQAISRIDSIISWQNAVLSLSAAGALLRYLHALCQWNDLNKLKDISSARIDGHVSSILGQSEPSQTSSTWQGLREDLQHQVASALVPPPRDSKIDQIGDHSHFLRSVAAAHILLPVMSLKSFRLSSLMSIGQDTMDALQVFHVDSGGTSSKMLPLRDQTGSIFSNIFSLLNHTRTADGRQALLHRLRNPLANHSDLSKRLGLVQLLRCPSNAKGIRGIKANLSSVKSLPRVLSKAMFTAKDWSVVHSTIKACERVLKILADPTNWGNSLAAESENGIPDDIADLLRLAKEEEVADTLHTLTAEIANIINLETSKREGRVIVNAGVDDVLDDLRRQYEGLPDFLGSIATALVQTLPEALSANLRVIYMPQLGFLIALPRQSVASEAAALHAAMDNGSLGYDANENDTENAATEAGSRASLVFRFRSLSTAYFKNAEMSRLDSQIGDLHGMLVDREIELAFSLRQIVRERYQTQLMLVHSKLVSLDVYLSLAEAATCFQFTCPQLALPTKDSTSRIYARGARHPLLERIVGAPNYIANDIDLEQNVTLLTGANASGKSVYLKTVALLVYLTHVGSHVPAEPGCTIPLVDRMLTRVAGRESVSRPQSAFLLDLQQISTVIRASTPRSLVIIDEFGKGTTPPDGVGLFVGVMRHLAARRDQAPMVLAVTHFHEIVTHSLLPAGVKHLTTQIQEKKASGKGWDAPSYLYRIEPGVCRASLGAQCAATAGIPEPIITRGMMAATYLALGQPVPLLHYRSSRDQKASSDLRISLVQELLSLDIPEQEAGDGDWQRIEEFLQIVEAGAQLIHS